MTKCFWFVKRLIAKLLLFAIWLLLFISAGLFFFSPIAHQALQYLKFGDVLPRDLYWFLADPSCEATGNVAMGWDGMDICRQSHIEFTSWVGMNNILNWFCDIHLSILYFLTAIVLISVLALSPSLAAALERGLRFANEDPL